MSDRYDDNVFDGNATEDNNADNHEFDDFNSDDMHFDDSDLDAALADFEKEFSDEPESTDDGSHLFDDIDSAEDLLNDSSAEHSSDFDDDAPSGSGIADEAQEAVDFEDELEGLLGNKAKVAVLITRLNSAELLAAFLHLADISALCLPSAQGAVAVLRNLEGNSPEAAASDLSRVVSGLGVVLAVNRADKLEATLYLSGEAGQTFAPPILFTTTAPFVEDLMLGITTVPQLNEEGITGVDTSEFDTKKAYDVIARYLNTGPNTSY